VTLAATDPRSATVLHPPRLPAPGQLRPIEVRVPAQSLERFAAVVEQERFADWRAAIAATANALQGRVVWHVSSTSRGGGVAEMMGPEIGCARDAGIDARWMVIAGTPEFFAITKRLHNRLHGDPGDGGTLEAAERRLYRSVLRENAAELAAVVRRGDVVVLHDPQTAGLAGSMRRRGATVVWRCHIGHDDLAQPLVEEAWEFLRPSIAHAHATVFSREGYVPTFCRDRLVRIVRPAIDPFSPKNQELAPEAVRAIMVRAGIVEGRADDVVCTFRREDGSPGRVDRGADILRVGRAPAPEVPLVVQISRWDRLKDHAGVMRGFVHLEEAEAAGAHLVLAGPSVSGVADDPDGPAVLAELTAAWRALPHERRRRVQIASLPMVDPGENAAMVNALQRHAAVVVQKSIQEGFGLTVTEAMWKGRPVLASAVGGIVDQITDGEDGVLLADPTDTDGFAGALRRLLADPGAAGRLGTAASRRVRADSLLVRLLADDARVIAEALA
jgi:trehalose synthase